MAQLILCLTLIMLSPAFGLSPYYYSQTCPSLEFIVGRVVREAVAKEPRMAASLLRLHFHDCFVNGCDGSVLLDDMPNFTGEKTAGPNLNSVRGFEVIDAAKAEVERFCKGIVSCADILALAVREAVLTMRGPFWHVEYGRRDSTTASRAAANQQLPAPNSTADILVQIFGSKGLSLQDMVVLSGAHTIGFVRCGVFKDRLYNFKGTGQPDPTMNKELLVYLRTVCPDPTLTVDNTFTPLDVRTPFLFDNTYFSNLKAGMGKLFSDQTLESGGRIETQFWVGVYSREPFRFFWDFAGAMLKMGRIQPLTGINGEIRRSCRAVNS